MNAWLQEKLIGALRLTDELVSHLSEESLRLDLPGLPSNAIGGQLWCMIGARESFTRAIREGGWKGFACSLKEPSSRAEILQKLGTTRDALARIPFEGMTPAQTEAAYKILEHETMHHGQLIRYIYGNRLTFPDSWKKHYTV